MTPEEDKTWQETVRRYDERKRRDPGIAHREALDSVVRALAEVPNSVRGRIINAVSAFYDLDAADEPVDDECDCEVSDG